MQSQTSKLHYLVIFKVSYELFCCVMAGSIQKQKLRKSFIC